MSNKMKKKMKKKLPKRVQRWAYVDDTGAVGAVYLTRPWTQPGVRVARLVEVRRGEVLLSCEDAEELRSIVSSPMLLTHDRDRAIDILRGRR